MLTPAEQYNKIRYLRGFQGRLVCKPDFSSYKDQKTYSWCKSLNKTLAGMVAHFPGGSKYSRMQERDWCIAWAWPCTHSLEEAPHWAVVPPQMPCSILMRTAVQMVSLWLWLSLRLEAAAFPSRDNVVSLSEDLIGIMDTSLERMCVPSDTQRSTSKLTLQDLAQVSLLFALLVTNARWA